ncbi:uncharacterized protein RJT21DRAFT_119614 [Scheffersomyces amazonensis]|uniref:uncharacterized protein n=1 Tax=Scheffersomyces amazonensis TaxID=1078765 RepID=UPI00315D92BE
MGKFHRKQLNKIYAYPLPVTITSEAYSISLPEVYPHNPLSWLYFTLKYWQYTLTYEVPQLSIPLINVEYINGTFAVYDDNDMTRLWTRGFFGKGILSRSEPTWKDRTINRLNLSTSSTTSLAMEDVTVKRREGRQKFKDERSKLQALELLQRKGEISPDDLKTLEELRDNLNVLKNASINRQVDSEVRDEDEELIDDSNQLINNLEFLQLQPIEAFFLKFALNVISVSNNNLDLSLREMFQICCESYGTTISLPNHRFLIEYAVYHHYRSLGWCVRSGIKFGCDMLLYKRGPPFTHAEHAVMIIPNDPETQYDWFDMASRARVIGTVKKNFVIAFVDYPQDITDINLIWNQPGSDKEILSRFFESFKVTEILYKRWTPSRTRD